MSFAQYWRAMTLVKREEVELQTASFNALFFRVKEHSVYYELRKKVWNCDCEYGSLWSKQDRRRPCYHIRACIMWLNNKGKRKNE